MDYVLRYAKTKKKKEKENEVSEALSDAVHR
jgi:hypothetical protein